MVAEDLKEMLEELFACQQGQLKAILKKLDGEKIDAYTSEYQNYKRGRKKVIAMLRFSVFRKELLPVLRDERKKDRKYTIVRSK